MWHNNKKNCKKKTKTRCTYHDYLCWLIPHSLYSCCSCTTLYRLCPMWRYLCETVVLQKWDMLWSLSAMLSVCIWTLNLTRRVHRGKNKQTDTDFVLVLDSVFLRAFSGVMYSSSTLGSLSKGVRNNRVDVRQVNEFNEEKSNLCKHMLAYCCAAF